MVVGSSVVVGSSAAVGPTVVVGFSVVVCASVVVGLFNVGCHRAQIKNSHVCTSSTLHCQYFQSHSFANFASSYVALLSLIWPTGSAKASP